VGLFSDRFIANFLENAIVKVFENLPVFDEVMCIVLGTYFLAQPVLCSYILYVEQLFCCIGHT